ncbi:methyltransferase family protein [Ketobacter sp.]|uniref:methyltransferase family protein n=1 Tax=Ketobacter sp. TaxID=2083498 RepID=UPI000F175F59|nr:hypothetical protein [Ketobacter sp.]RLT94749.1 MAG: isoprenylcysteine carboxylmethyltransferase family protein [Ketobacter sp.]
MTTLIHQPTNTLDQPLTAGRKSTLLLYGIASYLIGCAGLVAVILAMAGILPMGSFIVLTDNALLACVINVLLIGLFGLQHSIMARPFFKRAFANTFSAASERATFVWGSGATLLIILALWQPVSGHLWQVESLAGRTILWCLFGAGWSYLFAATFAINHWDLFGLRQIWFAVNDRAYQAPEFKENWMYRFSRHPIMLGALIGMWCVPDMSATKLVMTLSLTAYIFTGLRLEENDLVREFGEQYLEYKKRVGMFFSWK